MGGVDVAEIGEPLLDTEASPHAQGGLGSHLNAGFGPGSIPACAGRTTGRYRLSGVSAKHPRMRGADDLL